MDGQNKTPEEILDDAYTNAPSHIQTYLSSGTFETVVQTLKDTHRLSVETAEVVGNEVFLVLLGIHTPEELSQNLIQEAKLSPELLEPVLQTINEQVFVPLKNTATPSEAKTLQQVPIEPVVKLQEVPIAQVQKPVVETLPETPHQELVQSTPLLPTPSYATPAPIPVQLHAVIVPHPPQGTMFQSHPHTALQKPEEYQEMLSMMRTMAKDIDSLKKGIPPRLTPWKDTKTEATKELLTPAPIVEEPPKRGGDPYHEPLE